MIMCVICISPKGIRQPNIEEFRDMWNQNPHGAGYMVARNGIVEIHKGFMSFTEFTEQMRLEQFTNDDVVVYHFRISTQAGVNPEMTQPFPLTITTEGVNALDIGCQVGVAHNGIIRLTSDGNREYSDTALFIMNYMTRIIRDVDDIDDEYVLDMIKELIGSKMVLMNANGDYRLIGSFTEKNGLIYSNTYHIRKTIAYYKKPLCATK